jgi:hypothetical protein
MNADALRLLNVSGKRLSDGGCHGCVSCSRSEAAL